MSKRIRQLQPGPHTADDLMKAFGIALQHDADTDRWLVGFHFAGPDVLASGRTIEDAIGNFRATVEIEQSSPPPGEPVKPGGETERRER